MESPNVQWLLPTPGRILKGGVVVLLILGVGTAVAAERRGDHQRERGVGNTFHASRNEAARQPRTTPPVSRTEPRRSYTGSRAPTAHSNDSRWPRSGSPAPAGVSSPPSSHSSVSGTNDLPSQRNLPDPGWQRSVSRPEPVRTWPQPEAKRVQSPPPASRTRDTGPRTIEMPRQDALQTPRRNDRPAVEHPRPVQSDPKAPVLSTRTNGEGGRSGGPSMEDIRKRLGSHNERGGSDKQVRSPLPVNPKLGREDRAVPDREFKTLDLRGHRGESSKEIGPSMRIVSPKSPGNGDFEGKNTARLHFPERVKSGELSHLTKGAVAKNVQLDRQYRLSDKGDVARQLGLDKQMRDHRDITQVRRVPKGDKPLAGPTHSGPKLADGGHHDKHHDGHRDNHRRHLPYHGPIHAHFTKNCFHLHYCGPGYYPDLCWYPHWGPWVAWSWNYRCLPVWDPRPIWCRPVVYVAAPVWVYWQVPVWNPLPAVACGTWVDVPPVVVAPQQYDLQLLAVRFVDPGHPEEDLGPRYRVWFRNNSTQPITRPFNVTLLASMDDRVQAGLPQAGVRANSIQAGEVQAVDIRLPAHVNAMAPGAAGGREPFAMLHAIVDGNREIDDTVRANNGVAIARGEILPIDPAAFEVQPKAAAGGGEVLLAGEGFGPEPGQVLIHLGGIEMQGEILGWYDLGVRLCLPNLPLAGPAEAELIVIRGDGAAANPVKVTLTPAAAGPEIMGPAVDLN